MPSSSRLEPRYPPTHAPIPASERTGAGPSYWSGRTLSFTRSRPHTRLRAETGEPVTKEQS
jgi:hypothetical protein